MSDDWSDRVTAVIRSGEAVSFPLERLREELRARFGLEPPGLEELRRLLRARPDRFIVVDPPPLPLAGSVGETAPELLGALRAAGLAPSPQVLLRGQSEPAADVETAAPLTRAVSRSLSVLWTAGPTARFGRGELAQATRAANQLRGTLRRLTASPRLPPKPSAGGTRTLGPPAGVERPRWSGTSEDGQAAPSGAKPPPSEPGGPYPG